MTTEYIPPPNAFPKGTYALPKANNICPKYGFKTWFYYQDTEDYYNGNRWPSDMGMSGIFKSDVFRLNVCTHPNANKGQSYDWPAGNYCIMKMGECPTGFDSGSITWDDENDFNANGRKNAGAPDGVFADDTTVEYCCREDGSAARGIKLPISRAFYLLRYKGETCQKVAEMNVKEEVVQWDDEDTGNSNSKSGAHPMDSGNSVNHRLHYCLYTPLAEALNWDTTE